MSTQASIYFTTEAQSTQSSKYLLEENSSLGVLSVFAVIPFPFNPALSILRYNL